MWPSRHQPRECPTPAWLAMVAVALVVAAPAWAGPRRGAPRVPGDGAAGASRGADRSGAASSDPAQVEAQRAEAAAALARGTKLFQYRDYDGALAEFLLSRRLYPARGNTLNAALALRELERYDEALDMFEALLRDFPSIKPADKQQVQSAVRELRGRVGTVAIQVDEPGAKVHIAGRERGTTPLSHPVRVSVGAHLVRVVKEGYTPLEVRVEVASEQQAVVEGRLLALRESGTLRVVEQSGAAAQVLVDNIEVGVTPWQGRLGLGRHTVVLRGEGKLGTQPAGAVVRRDEEITLTLALEALECSLRVTPEPIGASIALDRVMVGNGLWEGSVRCGAHQLEVAEEGFLPVRRQLSLEPAEQGSIEVVLERDPDAALWRRNRPGRVAIDLAFAPALSWSLGGEVADGCGESCTFHIPFGFTASMVGGYQFGNGFGLGIHAGYAHVTQSSFDRPFTVRALPGGQALGGTVDDELLLQGALLGAGLWVRHGEAVPLTARLTGGVLLGTMRDQRTVQLPGVIWPLPSMRTDAHYGMLNPEFRIAYDANEILQLSLVLQAQILFSIERPAWQQSGDLYHPELGYVSMDDESLSRAVVVLISPGLGAALSFR